MTTATLIKKAFNWGGSLTVSEVQSTIIMVGSMAARRQTWCWSRKWYILQATGSQLTVILSGTWRKDLKARPHSDTLPSTRPHLLIVPLPLGAVFFQTTARTIRKCAEKAIGSEPMSISSMASASAPASRSLPAWVLNWWTLNCKNEMNPLFLKLILVTVFYHSSRNPN